MDKAKLTVQKRHLLGVDIHAVTMNQALDIIHDCIISKKSLQIGVVNAAKIVNMARQVNLRNDVLSSDLVIADGSAVVWASRILRQPLPERVTGIDLMLALLNRGKNYNYRVFCLGATEEVSKSVGTIIESNYKGVQIVGRHNGYFHESEEESVARLIADAKPDILFVAITSPKKEKFLARWSKVINVPVCHGVGGAFDVMAGKVNRAPENWQKAGLEWLYRLKQEPQRMWRRYLVTNTIFVSMLALAMINKIFKPKDHSTGK